MASGADPRWRAENDDAVEPVYSFAGIEHLAGRLDADDAAWERWFERQGIAPLRVGYAELAEDPGGALMRVLGFLGVAGEFTGELPQPSMRRQSGEQSRAWAERYRREEEAHR